MINIDDKTRRLSQATIVVGYKQENKAESVEFKIPDYLKEYGKKICFKTKDGKVFSKLFDNTTSNIFTFTRTETQYGELDATIQFFKKQNEDMIVYKTSMLHIIFNETINCEDEVQPDEPKIPILESLIEKVTDLNNTITENEKTRNNNENIRISNENIRIANETQRDIYYTGIQNKVNNGEFNGATYLPNVDTEGNITWTNDKGLENPSVQNIRGPQGIQGPQGEAFKIKKTYSSIEEMQTDFNNMEVGDYVMIANSVEIEDNAKLYAKAETEWVFITDFSGATGIQGPQGIQGIQGTQGERGIGISKLEVKQGYLYVTLTDNSTQNAGLIITDEVKQWLVTEITNNAESTFNQYYDTKVSEFNENVQTKLDEYNANAEALANKVVELETENTSLKNQIPSGEATGNPIHLTDSSDMECEIVLIGNAEQKTRSGNLYNSNTNTSGYINSTGDITSNNNWIVTDYIPVIALINYYTAGNTNLTAGEGVYGAYYNSNKELISTFPYSNYKIETATIAIPENAAYIRFSLYKYADNTATFDFYTDAPSPNYPSKVVTVGQNVNIFDKDNVNKINAWIDNSGYFQYSSAFKILYIQCDKNKDYVVSSKYLRGIAFLNEVPKTGLTSTNFKIQNVTELTLNSQDNTYLAVWYYATASGLTEQEILDSIKIVEGTEVGGYSPYGQGSVEIEVCNENFFNFDKLTVTGRDESEVTFNKELGKIEATASTSDKYLLKSFTMKGLTVGETYTIGFKHKTKNCTFGGNGVFRLSSTASYNSYDYGYVNGSTSETYSTKTFVATTDIFTLSFLGVNGTAPSDTCTMYAKDIMLVKGATATDYIPHKSYTKVLPIQKEFVKIGDVEGTFVKVEGKWYEKHDIPKYIFTGNESFSRGSTRNGFYYFETTISDLAGKYAETNRILCNVAKEISSSDMYEVTSQKDLIGTTSKNVRLMLSNINTVAELQACFAEQYANGTPATAYYLSTTPKLIECTAEQSAILNIFYTYKNVTNISMSGIGTLKVNYKKDLETMFNNIIKQIPNSTSDTTET